MHTLFLLFLLCSTMVVGWLLFEAVLTSQSSRSITCPCCTTKNTVHPPACPCCGQGNVLLGASNAEASSSIAPSGVLFLACQTCEPVTLHVARCAGCNMDLTAQIANLDLTRPASLRAERKARHAILEALTFNHYAPLTTAHEEKLSAA